MLAEVGAGIGPAGGPRRGWRIRRRRTTPREGRLAPVARGTAPSPNVVDDVEVGSVTTTTRLSIGQTERVTAIESGAERRARARGGGSTDRGSGSDGGSDASDDAATDDAKMCPGVSRGGRRGRSRRGNERGGGSRGAFGRFRVAARDARAPRGVRGAGPASGVPGSAPPAAAEARRRMMRALGLDARMSSEKLAATARRYANLMAASREGHVMAASDAAAGEGGRRGVFGDGRPPRRRTNGKRRAEDRPDAKDATDGSFEMVVERDLELATLCEHHLLPFHGAVHVAYLRPASGVGRGPRRGRGLAREALQRVVTKHGRRFQVQERLTRDIARDVIAASGARGVMVAVRASHLCMIARGWKNRGPPRARARVSAPSRGAAREEARFGARSRAKRAGRRVEDECQYRRCVSTMRVDDESLSDVIRREGARAETRATRQTSPSSFSALGSLPSLLRRSRLSFGAPVSPSALPSLDAITRT